jgi:hypothetical protein
MTTFSSAFDTQSLFRTVVNCDTEIIAKDRYDRCHLRTSRLDLASKNVETFAMCERQSVFAIYEI